MNVGLLVVCLATASLPPAGLPLAPRAAALQPTAPTEIEGAPEDASPPDPDPEPTAPPPGDTAGPSDSASPTDEERPSEPEPEPEPEPETEPPTSPATLAPTTLPSPGDVDADGDDEPFEDEPLSDEPYDPLRDSPEAMQARHFIRAGVALLIVGGALSVTAVVFGTVDPCTRGIGNSCQEAAARRAALAIGIPGALMVVGGATSLAIGLVRRRELRASVAVGNRSAIVGVSGRF